MAPDTAGNGITGVDLGPSGNLVVTIGGADEVVLVNPANGTIISTLLSGLNNPGYALALGVSKSATCVQGQVTADVDKIHRLPEQPSRRPMVLTRQQQTLTGIMLCWFPREHTLSRLARTAIRLSRRPRPCRRAMSLLRISISHSLAGSQMVPSRLTRRVDYTLCPGQRLIHPTARHPQ